MSQPHEFATTHWSMILAAGDSRPEASQRALAALCETYWYPLYVYLRRQGHDRQAAEDLTQGFFARLLERHDLAQVDPRRGRFRSWLLASLNHFRINEWHKARAAKRGGGQCPLSLDFEHAERRLQQEPLDRQTPEALFDRQWALTLLERVQQAVENEYHAAGKTELFGLLKPYLVGEATATPYRQTAARLGLSEGAVKVAVHRLRRRFGELLRAEIAQTVARDDDVNQELADLFRSLQPPSR